MLTILITGFGRFPGSPFNPSGPLARQLAVKRRPALGATRRIAHVFATRYAAVDRELPEAIAREKPAVVLLFGVATRARHLRIEEFARNRVSMLFPDAGGYLPAKRAIVEGAVARRNRLPVARLVGAARSTGTGAVPSRNAGSYLCNYAYWRALEAADRPDGPLVVAFVHVPPVRLKPRPIRAPKGGPRGTQRPGVGVSDLVRAGEAVLMVLVADARGLAREAAPASHTEEPLIDAPRMPFRLAAAG